MFIPKVFLQSLRIRRIGIDWHRVDKLLCLAGLHISAMNGEIFCMSILIQMRFLRDANRQPKHWVGS